MLVILNMPVHILFSSRRINKSGMMLLINCCYPFCKCIALKILVSNIFNTVRYLVGLW